MNKTLLVLAGIGGAVLLLDWLRRQQMAKEREAAGKALDVETLETGTVRTYPYKSEGPCPPGHLWIPGAGSGMCIPIMTSIT